MTQDRLSPEGPLTHASNRTQRYDISTARAPSWFPTRPEIADSWGNAPIGLRIPNRTASVHPELDPTIRGTVLVGLLRIDLQLGLAISGGVETGTTNALFDHVGLDRVGPTLR